MQYIFNCIDLFNIQFSRRGPKKNGLIKQFLTDVDWGELDYLVIDTPPGTSDEHISIVQYRATAMHPAAQLNLIGIIVSRYLQARHGDGAIVVTTPEEVWIDNSQCG